MSSVGSVPRIGGRVFRADGPYWDDSDGQMESALASGQGGEPAAPGPALGARAGTRDGQSMSARAVRQGFVHSGTPSAVTKVMRTWLVLLLMGFAILIVGRALDAGPTITLDDRTGVGIASATLVVDDGRKARAGLDPATPAGQALPAGAEGKARLEIEFVDGRARVFDVGWISPAARHDLHVVVATVDSVRAEWVGAAR